MMYRVLIAEDEDMIRKGLVYSVPWQEMDCCVAGEARNGMEGIDEIRQKHPDIVLIDINMPVADGLTMLEQTRDCRYSAIILTGYSDFSYAREAIRFGVTDYLLKPLDMEELRSAVEKAKTDCQVKDAYISSLKEKKGLKEVSAMGDLRKNPVEKVLVKEMVAYIEENYGKKVLMQDVVDKFHYSETFLNKRFKESTGITFNEYLNRYRIQKSLEMLQKGEENLNTIAWKCGFGDYKYFGSVFRKYVGRSPKEYVKAIR